MNSSHLGFALSISGDAGERYSPMKRISPLLYPKKLRALLTGKMKIRYKSLSFLEHLILFCSPFHFSRPFLSLILFPFFIISSPLCLSFSLLVSIPVVFLFFFPVLVFSFNPDRFPSSLHCVVFAWFSLLLFALFFSSIISLLFFVGLPFTHSHILYCFLVDIFFANCRFHECIDIPSSFISLSFFKIFIRSFSLLNLYFYSEEFVCYPADKKTNTLFLF